MVEQYRYNLEVKKTPDAMARFLKRFPEFSVTSEELLPDDMPRNESWQEELDYTGGLIDTTEELYRKGDQIVLNNYRKLFDSFYGVDTRYRMPLPPFDEAVEKTIAFLRTSHKAYSWHTERPYNSQKNTYRGIQSGLFSPRKVRLAILGNGLTGQPFDKEAVKSYEGLAPLTNIMEPVNLARTQIWWHLTPLIENP